MNEIVEVLDLIYEAAFVPEQWDKVLDVMAHGADAHGAALFNASSTAPRAIHSASLDDLSVKMLDEGWLNRNIRAARMMTLEHDGFVNEAEVFTQEEYDTLPIYTEVMKPLGYGFGTATLISPPSSERIVVAVEKKRAMGPFTAASISYLDQLRPHLARAAMMSSRLEFERINAAMEALQISGLPSATLRNEGRVMAANRLLEHMAPQITMGAYGRIRFHHTQANALLYRTLEQHRNLGSHASKSFPLPMHENLPPAIVHIIPVEGRARDIFSDATAFLIVTPIDRQRVPAAETIQGLFDLTPTEAKVARQLAAGSDVISVATHLSVSTETIRSHVKAILAKSGMSRQTDFIAAIASIRTIER
ncbi:MAG TPA: helix-turn-helix transcriptional regulator [Rhizobiaceae bacterium]|nr:helix-turn-helix transcriptional regulator [Rhizobiaceae bacterium]